MAVEPLRGCGYRVVGGLYLVCPPTMFHVGCDRLPYELGPCPACGEGVHFTRSLRQIDPVKLFPEHSYSYHQQGMNTCAEKYTWCPLCHPKNPVGFTVGVGEQFYTPRTFINEARLMGVSKRIPGLPRKFELGKSWVYFMHKNACGLKKLGIFSAFRPKAVEQLFWESQKTDKLIEELGKKHIEPVWIPDGDVDHAPRSKNGGEGEE